MLENLAIGIACAAIGAFLGWYGNIVIEKRKERREHRDDIRQKVLDPMLAALERYSCAVSSSATVELGTAPLVESPTDNPLYAQAGRHFPDLFAAWREYENSLGSFGERLSLLHSTVKEYLEQKTDLAVTKSPSQPPWIDWAAVGVVCCDALGCPLHQRPLCEMQPLPGGLMPGGGEAWGLGFPPFQVVYGSGNRNQMELLRDVIVQCAADADIRKHVADFIDVRRHLQEMQRQVKQRILEALEDPGFFGKCDFCP